MKTAWAWTQTAFAGIGGVLGWYLGGVDGFLYALIAFVVIDYITGVMCAIVKKELSSEVGARGICKKVLVFALVGLGHLVDSQILGNGSALRTAIIFFYIANEGFSIIENSAVLGLPVPQVFKDALAQIKNKTNGGDSK
jgi:toxin secretion/phage lysis holin